MIAWLKRWEDDFDERKWTGGGLINSGETVAEGTGKEMA